MFRIAKKENESSENNTNSGFYVNICSKIQNSNYEASLFLRLAELTNSENIESQRIYKEEFRNLFCQRYIKDKVTGFFEFEFIEDYASIKKIVGNMVNLKYQ